MQTKLRIAAMLTALVLFSSIAFASDPHPSSDGSDQLIAGLGSVLMGWLTEDSHSAENPGKGNNPSPQSHPSNERDSGIRGQRNPQKGVPSKNQTPTSAPGDSEGPNSQNNSGNGGKTAVP